MQAQQRADLQNGKRKRKADTDSKFKARAIALPARSVAVSEVRLQSEADGMEQRVKRDRTASARTRGEENLDEFDTQQQLEWEFQGLVGYRHQLQIIRMQSKYKSVLLRKLQEFLENLKARGCAAVTDTLPIKCDWVAERFEFAEVRNYEHQSPDRLEFVTMLMLITFREMNAHTPAMKCTTYVWDKIIADIRLFQRARVLLFDDSRKLTEEDLSRLGIRKGSYYSAPGRRGQINHLQFDSMDCVKEALRVLRDAHITCGPPLLYTLSTINKKVWI
jgi:hypothetical protein